MTDSAGATGTATTTTYDPYGNVVSTSGSLTTNLMYSGQIIWTAKRPYYHAARYYDPTTAQFMSLDPAWRARCPLMPTARVAAQCGGIRLGCTASATCGTTLHRGGAYGRAVATGTQIPQMDVTRRSRRMKEYWASSGVRPSLARGGPPAAAGAGAVLGEEEQAAGDDGAAIGDTTITVRHYTDDAGAAGITQTRHAKAVRMSHCLLRSRQPRSLTLRNCWK